MSSSADDECTVPWLPAFCYNPTKKHIVDFDNLCLLVQIAFALGTSCWLSVYLPAARYTYSVVPRPIYS